MKKILLITTMAATLTGLTALGQGNFVFGTGASYVWTAGSGVGVRGGALDVSFLWAPGTPTTRVATDTGIGFTPTNQLSAAATAWNSILNDPNYTLAVNVSGGTNVVVGTLTAAGGVSYNAGGNFLVNGTSSNGGTVNVYMIAWSSLFATPALAQAGGSSVGWSLPFAYSYAPNPGAAGGNFSLAAVNAGVAAQFGVSPVPEPATFALAGLGAAAMLIFRRRK